MLLHSKLLIQLFVIIYHDFFYICIIHYTVSSIRMSVCLSVCPSVCLYVVFYARLHLCADPDDTSDGHRGVGCGTIPTGVRGRGVL